MSQKRATQITDPAYDIAFSALLLRHPPLLAPRAVRPVIDRAARSLARRFARSYDVTAREPIDPSQFAWYSRLHSLRVLTDVARWRAEGRADAHRGHPWFAMEATLRAALNGIT